MGFLCSSRVGSISHMCRKSWFFDVVVGMVWPVASIGDGFPDTLWMVSRHTVPMESILVLVECHWCLFDIELAQCCMNPSGSFPNR